MRNKRNKKLILPLQDLGGDFVAHVVEVGRRQGLADLGNGLQQHSIYHVQVRTFRKVKSNTKMYFMLRKKQTNIQIVQ